MLSFRKNFNCAARVSMTVWSAERTFHQVSVCFVSSKQLGMLDGDISHDLDRQQVRGETNKNRVGATAGMMAIN